MKLHDDKVPLRLDDSQAIRVGNTRVLFYLVVEAFQPGATPEEIVARYDTLSLADTYGAIAYYLRHHDEVDRWLAALNAAAVETRREIEANQPSRENIQAKLRARQADLESSRVASGD